MTTFISAYFHFADIFRLGNSRRYSRQVYIDGILFRSELRIALRMEFELLLRGRLERKTKS